jgi:hypothetical protein
VSRGFSEEDARELVLFAKEIDETEDPMAALAEGRGARQMILEALEDGLAGGRLVPLILLAERLGPRADADGGLLAQLLADTALASGAPLGVEEAVRHHAVAGRLAQLSRRVSASSLREAAMAAADPPPDNRRGNRRYHYESLLLKLFASRVG